MWNPFLLRNDIIYTLFSNLPFSLNNMTSIILHVGAYRSTSLKNNQSILKEVSPEYSLEGPMLKLKLQYFGHLMQRSDSLEKNPDGVKDWRQEEKGTTEDEMVGWHHWRDGREFEPAPGAGDGQGSLVSCSPWYHKEADTAGQLNWIMSDAGHLSMCLLAICISSL